MLTAPTVMICGPTEAEDHWMFVTVNDDQWLCELPIGRAALFQCFYCDSVKHSGATGFYKGIAWVVDGSLQLALCSDLFNSTANKTCKLL